MPLDVAAAVMCGVGAQEVAGLELEPGPCQMLETEARRVQVSAHGHAACESRNRNSSESRDSRDTMQISTCCPPHPELNTEVGAVGLVFARGRPAYAQSARSRLHVSACDTTTPVEETTVPSLVGWEQKQGPFVMLHHKTIGFGSHLSNYCFACFPETKGVCFRHKNMGANVGPTGGWRETCCRGRGGEKGEAVREAKWETTPQPSSRFFLYKCVGQVHPLTFSSGCAS